MKVGIFFVIGNDVLLDAIDISGGEVYGEAINHGEHYVFHENFVPASRLGYLFCHYDYDHFPRGRVVFFPKTVTSVIYFDPCMSTIDIAKIVELFELLETNYSVQNDEHYRCSHCIKKRT